MGYRLRITGAIAGLYTCILMFAATITFAQESIQQPDQVAKSKKNQIYDKQKAEIIAACSLLDQALINRDSTALKVLLHQQLYMRHSNGLVETKPELLQHLGSGYLHYRDIVPEQLPTLECIEGHKLVRVQRALHVSGDLQGTAFDVRLDVVEIWLYGHGTWQLLNRQSVKKI